MNYYQRCLKRLENATDIVIDGGPYMLTYEFDDVSIGRATGNGVKFYCYFRGVTVPLTQQEAEGLYAEAVNKYDLQQKARNLKALEEL